MSHGVSNLFISDPDEKYSMRTTSNETTQIPATATKIEGYIAVNFYWLLLPIAAVLQVLLLLAIVVFESKSRHIPAWKSSQLAALLSIDSGTRMALVDANIREAEKNTCSFGERRGRKVATQGWRLGEMNGMGRGVDVFCLYHFLDT